MNIATSMVKKIRINEVENLDPITVIVENFKAGSGKIIIECFGESWSHFWSHMGEQYTLETFFLKASDDYIAGKLCRGREDEPDFEGMPKVIRKEIVKLRRSKDISKSDARDYYSNAEHMDNEVLINLNHETMADIFGDEWFFNIPDKPTREYKYLCKIIPVVKQAFQELAKVEVAS